jgi:hypothetical protein
VLRLVDARPELVERCDIVFGKDYLPELRKLGQNKLAARVETLFERAIEEYGDVKFRASTVGQTAKSELYDFRNLAIGKVVPDMQGPDQDGRLFKLSEFRGKVVLLYFWSEF